MPVRASPVLAAWFCRPRQRRIDSYPHRRRAMNEVDLLTRITIDPKIFGGKPIVRGRRLAVEHVLGMLASGATTESILEHYPFLEREDIRACLVFARRVVGRERVEPRFVDSMT